MINEWRDIRDAALRPIYTPEAIERYLSDAAAIFWAERIAERAYLKEQIEQEFSS